MRFKSRSRALAAAALSASVGLAGLTLAAAPAQAEPADIVRVAGTTRYGTAAEAATQAYPTGATNVVLASGEKFPDALAGGGLAGSLDAPILLATQNSVPAETQAALAELGADNVTILGGTEAISAAVEAGLEAAGLTVDRVAGQDRFETAALIAEELGGDTAVLANGLNFPDALAISPGTHKLNLPLLLTTANTLQEDAAAYLGQDTVDNVIIVGGTAVVSQAIEDALEADGKTVTRLAGATRYETSVAIAEFHTTVGFALDELVLATGEKFPDALAGGPFASQMNAPLVLTQTNTLTPATAAFIQENAEAIDTIYVLGGTAAVSDAVATAAAAAADEDAEGSNQTLAVSGASETRDVGATGARTCTVTAPAGSSVDLRVFPTADLRDTNGTISFVDTAAPANVADENAAPAVIANVNGAPVAGGGAQEVNNVISGGTPISVTIVGTGPGDVTLVSWVDSAGLTPEALDLTVPAAANTLPKTPREAFGIGCRTVFANEAAGGAFVAGNVDSVSKDADVFSIGGNSYFYDANDQFRIGTAAQCLAGSATPVTLQQFEAAISPSDDVSGNYATDPTLQSQFCLVDDSPLNPDAVTAVSGTPTSITLQIEESQTGTADSYNVYRVQRPANVTPPACPDFTTATGRAQYALVGNVVDPNLAGDTSQVATFTDTGLAQNTYYCYVVTTVDQGDESTGLLVDDGDEAGVQTASTNETVRPTSVDAELANGASGFADRLDAGDVLRVCFSESMRAPDAGDAVELQDADGDIAVLTNGGNATFALGTTASTDVGTADATDEANPCPAARTLIITVTGAVVDQGSAATGNNIVNVPVTATDSAGVTDIVGNTWNIAGSADVYFDVAAAGADDLEAPAP